MSIETPPTIAGIDTLPEQLRDGSRLLIAGSTDPVANGVALQLLAQFGTGEDEAIVITTTRSAATTRKSYTAIADRGQCPALRIVDTLSTDQSVAALYTDSPTVYVPSAVDIERLIVAVDDLTDEKPPVRGERHFVARSLTPILESIPVETVSRMVDRLAGVRSAGGLSVFACQYTALSRSTLNRLATRMDGILWVEHSDTDGLTAEFERCRSSTSR